MDVGAFAVLEICLFAIRNNLKPFPTHLETDVGQPYIVYCTMRQCKVGQAPEFP